MREPSMTAPPIMRLITSMPRSSKRVRRVLTTYVIKNHHSNAPPKMERYPMNCMKNVCSGNMKLNGVNNARNSRMIVGFDNVMKKPVIPLFRILLLLWLTLRLFFIGLVRKVWTPKMNITAAPISCNQYSADILK